jgi:hypothetical protein
MAAREELFVRLLRLLAAFEGLRGTLNRSMQQGEIERRLE